MSFLPSIFNPKTMEVYVCSVDRTIESALARMYGFYPLGTGWKIPQEVDPQTLYPPFETNVTENVDCFNIEERLACYNIGYIACISVTKI